MNINDEKRFQRIMAIDYLKAIAVILVILTHALSKQQRLKIGGPFWISMAMPIFMIISGFTNALSADKNKINSLSQYFTREKLRLKLSRILIPYSVVVLFELFIGLSQKFLFETGPFTGFGLKDFITYILTGGTTPGSYYILILIQFIFLYPFMLLAYKKSAKKSVVLFFSIHLLFDLVANYLPIPGEIYRILIFRYLVFIIMGIALHFSYPKIRKIWKSLAVASLIYIGTYAYLGYIPKVFSKWTNTSLPTVFWALALVILGMKYLKKGMNNWLRRSLSRIGRGSYQIFLIQKLLFGFGLNKLFQLMHLNIFLKLIGSVMVCCFFGIILYDATIQKSQIKGE